MTAYLGCDTQQMEDTHWLFERCSNTLQSTMNDIQLDLLLLESNWEGTDFETFKARFWDEIRPQAKAVLDRIEEMGRELREQAQEQDDASSADEALWETLKDLYSNVKSAGEILRDTATGLWKGIKEGRIDVDSLRDGAKRLEDWWKSSGVSDNLEKIFKSKGAQRVKKFIPFVDIPIGIHDFATADDPVEKVTALLGLVGALPFPPTQILGLIGDGIGIADWVSEEFFDYDLSREAADFFSDASNDWTDDKTWGPGYYPWIGH